MLAESFRKFSAPFPVLSALLFRYFFFLVETRHIRSGLIMEHETDAMLAGKLQFEVDVEALL